MKYVLCLLVFCGVLYWATQPTASYIRTPLASTGVPVAWNLTNPTTSIVSGGRITYRINSAGSDDVPFVQVERALMASFQAWEDVPTSTVAFTRGPDTTSRASAGDGQFELFWLENSESTGDGLNVTGVLALTRIQLSASGEIVDAATAFNGVGFHWAVDGRSDSNNTVDIQEVATHEIGHAIGLSHSPIGGATMYPRTIAGRTQSRTLGSDDIIAASVAYPAPGFFASTGTLRGKVIDTSNGSIFGAHVVAVDANGNVTASGITQPDGTYSIQGLPPATYSVYAEPLDPLGASFFNRNDLDTFYANTLTQISTTQDFSVSLTAGNTTTQDFTVVRGAPALDCLQVRGPESTDFLNIGGAVPQGATNVIIGVSGFSLPQSGSPLSISGNGITINRTFFSTTNSGLLAVLADITISPTATPGSRNLIVTSGNQRSIMTGALEILPASASVVSSANFSRSVAKESIVSVFGQNLSTSTAGANSTPLPTSLGGATIRLRDNSGQELLAPLFYASAGQINFQLAPGLLLGPVLVRIGNNNGLVSESVVTLETVAPGLFSVNGSGQGLAAAAALRIRNGVQSYEQISRYDTATNQFVAIPIDLGPATDEVYLILFGTGIRFRSALSAVSYNTGGLTGTPQYAGLQPDFVGLDQINVPLARALAGRGLINVFLTVDGKPSNTLTVNIK